MVHPFSIPNAAAISSLLLAFAFMAPPPAIAESHRYASESSFDGIWRSRGYGWLWQIEKGRVTRFDVGQDFCILKLPVEDVSIGEANKPELFNDRNSLRLLQEDPDYFYTFDRQIDLPKRCSRTVEADADPLSVLDVAIEMIETHYAFIKQRGIDWPKLADGARAAVRFDATETDLFGALGRMLLPFGDTHVTLSAVIDGDEESLFATDARPRLQPKGPSPIAGLWNSLAAKAMLGGSARSAGDGAILYGRLDKGVGYLFVQSMSGLAPTDLEEVLDDAIGSFQGARAVIVDVSVNEGGLDSYARRIARRFAESAATAYYKSLGDSHDEERQAIVLDPPAGRPKFVGPVYLITSANTVSAAEVFTLAMRALSNVTHLGETTDGSLSDELWKTLPNGWTLSLSNEIYLDSEGVLWEGRGIPPEIPLAISRRSGAVNDKEKEAVTTVVEFAVRHSLR
jgi:carboxyl-terminal processing protease